MRRLISVIPHEDLPKEERRKVGPHKRLYIRIYSGEKRAFQARVSPQQILVNLVSY